MAVKSIKILLAEDDDGHATLVQRNLERAGIVNELTRFRDGQELLDAVLPNGQELQQHQNALVLLDIKMPRLDGIEVLARLKENPKTARLPVIMLTTTDDPREVQRCYEMGCNVYITKPVDYEAFVDAIRRLGLFLEVVTVP